MDEMLKAEMDCLHEQIRILREEKEAAIEEASKWKDYAKKLEHIMADDRK